MSLPNMAALHKVDLLFRALRLTKLYLHNKQNQFVGTVHREDLIHLGKQTSELANQGDVRRTQDLI